MRIQVDNWFERDEEPANMGRTASARSIRLTEPLDKQLDRAIVLSNAVYELWAARGPLGRRANDESEDEEPPEPPVPDPGGAP